MRARLVAAAALAVLAGCSSHDTGYPAGWTPLAASGHGCPDLAGTWRVRDPSASGDGLDVFHESDVVSPQHQHVHWDGVSIATDADGNGITLTFAQLSSASTGDAQTLQRHVHLEARCEDGLATVERRESGGAWTAYRLGKDTQGRLIGQRVDRTTGEPLLRWGDQSALRFGHSTHAVWSRWEPMPADAFATLLAAVQRASDVPRQGPARAGEASPFVPAPMPIKPATLPLPEAPPTRPGALPLGEAQAIVLGALPDSAVFEGMTPTPAGYRLRVGGIDAQGMAQLARRLAIDGHFAVRTEEPPAGASGASAPVPTRDARADVTLELVERVAR